jgi:hypothetical protein
VKSSVSLNSIFVFKSAWLFGFVEKFVTSKLNGLDSSKKGIDLV